jgi:hypothetical protein
MIDIFVSRFAGDRRGEDIIEPLLTDLAPALSRGQVEIDRSAYMRSVQMSANFRPGLKTGQTVEVIDSLQGEAWRGKIVAIDSAIEGAKMSTRLTIERMS